MSSTLSHLEAPPSPPSRLSELPLPPYRHVPGLTPHPVRDPKGHSHAAGPPRPGPEAGRIEEAWAGCAPYLYGVDLFNRAYFWEAHEAWEEVWNAVGHDSVAGRMLQGMIQVSAALLKRHMQVPRGAAGNFRKARAHFAAVEASRPRTFLGVDLPAWRRRVSAYLSGPDARFPYLRLEDPGAE